MKESLKGMNGIHHVQVMSPDELEELNRPLREMQERAEQERDDALAEMNRRLGEEWQREQDANNAALAEANRRLAEQWQLDGDAAAALPSTKDEWDGVSILPPGNGERRARVEAQRKVIDKNWVKHQCRSGCNPFGDGTLYLLCLSSCE